jgi:ketopantoate reductase
MVIEWPGWSWSRSPKSYGIATPVNEVVAALVRAKENLVMQRN